MSKRKDKPADNFHELRGSEGMEQIRELVKDIRIAMMSTNGEGGAIRSRPMATQDVPFDGTLYFLTRDSSAKVENIQQDQHVTLDYADSSHSKYITLRGKASVSKDRAKIKQLWSPLYKAWFPGGENDPEITVLRVDVSEGEYWEASSSKIIMGIRYIAAAVTGGSEPVGESGHIKVA